jgi:hypothetical protein
MENVLEDHVSLKAIIINLLFFVSGSLEIDHKHQERWKFFVTYLYNNLLVSMVIINGWKLFIIPQDITPTSNIPLKIFYQAMVVILNRGF